MKYVSMSKRARGRASEDRMQARAGATVLFAIGMAACQKGASSEPKSASCSTGQELAEGPACGKISCALGEVCCNAVASVDSLFGKSADRLKSRAPSFASLPSIRGVVGLSLVE